jgi:hypothetical protein
MSILGRNLTKIRTAALMLGTDKSRGYCLEMICADFLAGANLDNGNPELLLQSITRFFRACCGHLCVQRQAAAVRMFLSLFRLCILALEVSERYVQQFVPKSDSSICESRTKFDQHKGVCRY